jgi:hypothetical protein
LLNISAINVMKKHTVKTAKTRAWRYFSAYIRKRDPKCVTCGAPTTQAGHFWHNVLDFDEENVNGQCLRCNHFLSGNLAPYSVYLLKKLGKKKFDALDVRHTKALSGEKRSVEELLAIGDKYKNL